MSGSGNVFTSQIPKTAFGEVSVAEATPRVLMHFPYNLNTEIVNTSTTGSGSVTHANDFAVISSGAATSSSGTLSSIKNLEYYPGTGAICRFTAVFDEGVEGNSRIAGCGSSTDGFFFGYNGTAFGILYRAGGVDTWISQENWNQDPMDGSSRSSQTLVPQNGNVYQIQYQWLGFGQIDFLIENQYSGTLKKVHSIRYSNQNTTVSVNNPTFPFRAHSENTTNDTAVVIKVPLVGMYIQGKESDISYLRKGIDASKSVTTEAAVLTIRNKSTYQSVTNLVNVQPDFISLATDGSKSVIFRFYLNPTLGGTPSYTDISTNTSVVDYDVAGTTVTGGVLVASIPAAKIDNQNVLFKNYNLILPPGNWFTITAESDLTNSVLVGASWVERFT